MVKTLFIGDSHTCGYIAEPGKVGPGSYTYWNDNSYCDIYSEENKTPIAVYAMAGVNNRVYTDWLKTMFSRHKDIKEVFLCMSALNRFCIAYDPALLDEPISVDHFTVECVDEVKPNPMIRRYADLTQSEKQIQLFNKPTYNDYSNGVRFEISEEKGLVSPDLRKHTYMQVKLFYEMNTYLEKRDFLNCVYTWDNICTDHGAKLYLFHFTDRLKYPSDFEYYGKLKSTTIAPKTVQGFFSSRMIDHSKYLLPDQEHYNKTFHYMIATQYIPWLQDL